MGTERVAPSCDPLPLGRLRRAAVLRLCFHFRWHARCRQSAPPHLAAASRPELTSAPLPRPAAWHSCIATPGALRPKTAQTARPTERSEAAAGRRARYRHGLNRGTAPAHTLPMSHIHTQLNTDTSNQHTPASRLRARCDPPPPPLLQPGRRPLLPSKSPRPLPLPPPPPCC